jgi:hypothetical protein
MGRDKCELYQGSGYCHSQHEQLSIALILRVITRHASTSTVAAVETVGLLKIPTYVFVPEHSFQSIPYGASVS